MLKNYESHGKKYESELDCPNINAYKNNQHTIKIDHYIQKQLQDNSNQLNTLSIGQCIHCFFFVTPSPTPTPPHHTHYTQSAHNLQKEPKLHLVTCKSSKRTDLMCLL